MCRRDASRFRCGCPQKLDLLRGCLPIQRSWSAAKGLKAKDSPELLRLGSLAPNFMAETTHGPIDFHDFIGNQHWVLFFPHPQDYSPVCTTELDAFAKLELQLTKRGVKLIGLSANAINNYGGWIKDVEEVSDSTLRSPIIGDMGRQVALMYDM